MYLFMPTYVFSHIYPIMYNLAYIYTIDWPSNIDERPLPNVKSGSLKQITSRIYEVYEQLTGVGLSTARTDMPRQSELPAGLAMPAATHTLQAPSMLLGQARKPAPARVRSLTSSKAQPVSSALRGGCRLVV